MNYRTARFIHETVNALYWIENKEWSSRNKLGDAVRTIIHKAPFSIHDAVKRLVFKHPEKVIVRGETIVTEDGDTIRKFMFRQPARLTQEEFKTKVIEDITITKKYLGAMAQPTNVEIAAAEVFKSRKPLNVVTQIQSKVNLNEYPPFDPKETKPTVRTLRDIERLLKAIERMSSETLRYPDISSGGKNMRVGEKGDLLLIDVMPVYSDGARLIGDRPPHLIEHIQDAISEYREFLRRHKGKDTL